VRSRAAALAGAAAIIAFVVSGFSRTPDGAVAFAQGGGKPATGNPTPGTAQPEPPNPAARVTFVGCLQPVARRAAPADKSASATSPDTNAPSNGRFELTKAERSDRVLAGTAPLIDDGPATNASIKTYRLEGIDSQFSPFAGSRVEITGAIKGPSSADPPILVVEFVQRLTGKCP
jgi:hypothetical protein